MFVLVVTMDTLIIIPTYNEAENINNLLSEIFKVIPDTHILFVDDNSPDGTGSIIDREILPAPVRKCSFPGGLKMRGEKEAPGLDRSHG